jgi:membrane-bound serine protease (ClpP class)
MVAWGIVLLAAALLLVAVEVFLPSAGLVAVVAGLLAVAGVVCLFQESAGFGLAGIGSIAVLAPAVFIFAVKVLPSTPLGKKMFFGEAGKHEPVIPENSGAELEPLLGAEGEALTDLRPVGMARIEGQRIDVLSEVSFVPAGARVRVTAVEGSQIKVRPIV